MSYQEALSAAGAEVLDFEQFGSYQGDWWAKVRYEGKESWVNGAFGSCSGCDSFEAEFGWDEGHCEAHKYDDKGSVGCHQCAEAAELYEKRLADFGRGFLSDLRTQEEAEAEASRNIEWDHDAEKMLSWIKDHALCC